jgi:RiboL-PSP-HEPN
MQSALDQFRSNIVYVRNLGGLYRSIAKVTTAVLDLSDLLRAELVMCVSALDHYVHEVTRLGMLETLNGKRPQTPAFLKFSISIDGVLQALGTPNGDAWFDTQIRERHGYQSFQQPDKIADAIRLISSLELWNSLASALGDSAQNLKTRLQLIVERRNKIVHEADMDPTYPGSGTRWPITDALANDAVDFVERLCETVHSLL